MITFGECFALFGSFGYCCHTYKGPSGNLFPASASVNREFCSLGPCLLAGCSSSTLSTLGLPLLSPTRQGLGPTPCQGMHKSFEPPQEFPPSFSCRFWGDSGFWGVCFPIFFYFPVAVELSFCFMCSGVQECVSFSRLENAQRYNQVLPQYLIIHN